MLELLSTFVISVYKKAF